SQLFVHGAQFALEPFDWDSLLLLWSERSGLSTPSAEPAFVRFVLQVIERPVLQRERLERLRLLCARVRRSLFEGAEDGAQSAFRPAHAAPPTALAISVLPPA